MQNLKGSFFKGPLKSFSFFPIIILIFWANISLSQPVNPYTPAEYFPSKAVLIEWNFNNSIWPLYSNLINECQQVTEVILVVRDASEQEIMRTKLSNDGVPADNISYVHVPCERMWIRDHGPLAVNSDSGIFYMDFDDLANSGMDEYLPTNLANLWGLESYQIPWILCGGNFMVDSHRNLFCTDRLYTNNPSIDPDSINSTLHKYMGINSIITVSAQHNDYWGHIDMQIKLLNDTTLVMSSVSPGSGPNFDTLENNFNRMRGLISPNGKPYHIARIPMADNWKTYANSLIINNKVIVPIYNHPNDELAIQTYQELLPERSIVGINCNSIIGWEGAIHCITMQLFDEDYLITSTQITSTERGFKVYPNPISRGEVLNIDLNQENIDIERLRVISINGEVKKNLPIPRLTKSISFTWNLEPGLYIISIENEKVSYNHKIISK